MNEPQSLAIFQKYIQLHSFIVYQFVVIFVFARVWEYVCVCVQRTGKKRGGGSYWAAIRHYCQHSRQMFCFLFSLFHIQSKSMIGNEMGMGYRKYIAAVFVVYAADQCTVGLLRVKTRFRSEMREIKRGMSDQRGNEWSASVIHSDRMRWVNEWCGKCSLARIGQA